jgi:hypothetical protein
MPAHSSPVWFVVAWLAVWLGVTALLAQVSGWRDLAAEFRSDNAPDGERFGFVSGALGKPWFPVRFNTCLVVVVGPMGFGLSLWLPFRFRAPALFIPWTAVESVDESAGTVLLATRIRIRVRSHWPVITILGRAAKSLLASHQSFGGSADRKPLAPS